jgi:epoxyqueuosine reductase
VNFTSLKKSLLDSGAAVVGFGDVRDAVCGDISHLTRAVCIGIDRNLNERTVGALSALQAETAAWLKERGYRYLSIPPDSDRRKGKFVSKLYPLFCHKTAATCSGLGWIGKNGLVISPRYGPRLSWATVLTDAPLDTDKPIVSERCGDCSLCVDHCPSGALTGASWSRETPFVPLISHDRCTGHKKKSRGVYGKPNCGLCINICPYGRMGKSMGRVNEEVQGELPAIRQEG